MIFVWLLTVTFIGKGDSYVRKKTGLYIMG